MEITRSKELHALEQRLKDYPVVAVLGPRQCGKTTLAHQFARSKPSAEIHIFDLENPIDVARLDEPMIMLESLKGYVIMDEIQRRPELFPVLRVLSDRKTSTRFIILGSASPDLLAQSSESLAGRISYLEMGGFGLDILEPSDLRRLWIRGGFPRSFLARSEAASFQWRQDFVTTFLERDVPGFGIRIPSQQLRRFWTMLSHYHGQVFKASEIARSMMVADTTVRHYLDVLTQTFLMRQIQPWYYNTKKRLVKRPKIFFRDSGLLHALQSLTDLRDVQSSPKLGASWEGFALEQVIEQLELRSQEMFFWAVHTGAELDLVFMRHGRRWGVEVKYTDAPKKTKSMTSALSELDLEHLWVVYPGRESYPIDRNITAVGISDLNSIRFRKP
jgi:predicted AAA+ superfamily ATPase